MEGLRETMVVAGAEARRRVRSARLIVLFALFALFTSLVLLVVGFFAGQFAAQSAQLAGEEAAQSAGVQLMLRTGMVGLFFDWDRDLIDSLEQVPLVVLLGYRLVLLFLPFYVALLAFDQVSLELGQRSIRYLTIRARRSSVLFGKFLASAALILGLVLVVNGGIFVYGKLTHEWFGWGQVALSSLKFSLAAGVLALCYLALSTLCSTLFRSPALSLVSNLLLLLGLWVVNRVGSFFVERPPGEDGFPGPEQLTSWAAHLRYLSPSFWSTDLLHPRPGPFATSLAAFAGYTLVFLLLALFALRRRDV